MINIVYCGRILSFKKIDRISIKNDNYYIVSNELDEECMILREPNKSSQKIPSKICDVIINEKKDYQSIEKYILEKVIPKREAEKYLRKKSRYLLKEEV